MGYVKTNLAITVTCKCNSIVAATMIYGGMNIEEDFTETMAEVYNRGGKLEFINADETPVKLSSCSCKY